MSERRDVHVRDERTIAARLARWRVPLGFACGAVVLWAAAPTRATLEAGAAVAALGEAIRVWAAGHLNKARDVTASGPYRFVAHPLYVGSSVMGAGLAVACGSVLVAGLVSIYLVATLTAAIVSEEAFLRGAFGGRYDEYRRGAAPAARTRFSLGRAMANREYRALAGLVIAVLLLALKATYNGFFGGTVGR